MFASPGEPRALIDVQGPTVASAARVAAGYILFGLLWIWVSDSALLLAGVPEDLGFWAEVIKGSAFVLLSGGLVYWLVLREVRSIAKSSGVIKALSEGTSDVVIVKDLAGRYLFCNHAANQLISQLSGPIPGDQTDAMFGAEFARRMEKRRQNILQSGAGETFEETLQVPGRERTFLFSKTPIRDNNRQIIGFLIIARDISDRKLTEQRLRESEERFRSLFDHATDAFLLHDQTGRVVDANQIACEQMGYTREEILGLSPMDFDVRATPEQLAELGTLFRGGGMAAFDSIHRRKDGSTFPVEVRIRPFRLAGKWMGMSVTRDISERKRVEELLRAERDRFEKILETAPVVICSFLRRPDGSWCFPYASRKIEEIYEISPSELAKDASPIFAQIHPDDVPTVVAKIEESASALSQWRGEFRVRNPRLGEIWVEGRSMPVRLADGSTEWHGFIADITEQKRRAEALRASEERFRGLVSSAMDAIISLDSDQRVILFNRAAEVMFRIPEKEIIGKTIERFLPEGYRSKHRALISAFGEKGITSRAMGSLGTLTALRADGEEFPIEASISHMEVDGRKVYTVIHRDITDRVRAERELRESEERFRRVFEHAAMGIAIKDLEGNFVRCNPAYCGLLGYTEKEFQQLHFSDLIHPEDRNENLELSRKLLAERHATFEVENRYLHKSGRTVWVHKIVSLLPGPDGQPAMLMALVTDITERRRAARDLQQSERRFRTLITSLPDAVYINSGGVIAFCNPACVRLFGATGPEQLLGKSPFDLMHPDAHAEIRERIAQMAMTGEAVQPLEEKIVRIDGQSTPVMVTAVPITDKSQPAILVVLRDLTEQMRVEAQLRDQELLLREAGELAHVGGWGFDPATSEVEWTEETARIHDLTPGGVRNVSEAVGFYAAEDRNRIETAVRAAVEHGTPYDLELRIRSALGIEKWVRTICRPLIRDGKVVRVRGSIQDITDRKRVEQELRESEDRLRLALSAAMAIAFEWDARSDTSTRYFSNQPALPVNIGSPDPIAAIREKVHPDDRAGFDQAVQACLTSGSEYRAIFRLLQPDGSVRWLEEWGKLTRDAEGRPARLTGFSIDITDRKRAEEELRDSEKRFRNVIDMLPEAIYLCVDGFVVFCNPAFVQLLGAASPADVLGTTCFDLQPEKYHDAIRRRNATTPAERKRIGSVEEEIVRLDGRIVPVLTTAIPVLDRGVDAFLVVHHDLTELRRLEEQFRHAQKMEAVGRLAGGVAHDFNNLLTVINGYSDLLLGELAETDPRWEAVEAIGEAGKRAAGLTQQLLAFSRKAIVTRKLLDINEVVANAERLLRRLIGEDITLQTNLTGSPCQVLADPTQLDQVILNLAVNARDAMPDGGTLTFATRILELHPGGETPGELAPGRYVELAVIDTGTGISEEVRANIFEPFFTTKGEGKGTGLGLATVFGIIQGAGGHVTVESEVGRGATFRVLLPEATPRNVPALADPRSARRGTETILLVEDENRVRTLCQLVLKSQGYRVLSASSGREALDLLSNLKGSIDLLVTDVVMPGMSGRELASAVQDRYPDVRVLFMSGYTDDEIVRHGVQEDQAEFLQKPFNTQVFARKVRSVLDSPRRTPRLS